MVVELWYTEHCLVALVLKGRAYLLEFLTA